MRNKLNSDADDAQDEDADLDNGCNIDGVDFGEDYTDEWWVIGIDVRPDEDFENSADHLSHV